MYTLIVFSQLICSHSPFVVEHREMMFCDEIDFYPMLKEPEDEFCH